MSAMDRRPRPYAAEKGTADLPVRVHLGILIVIQLIMGVELLLLFYERLWINAFLVMAIMVITLSRPRSVASSG